MTASVIGFLVLLVALSYVLGGQVNRFVDRRVRNLGLNRRQALVLQVVVLGTVGTVWFVLVFLGWKAILTLP